MAKLIPFADDSGLVSVGELTIEKGSDRIALYGSLEIIRDRSGLAQARAVRSILEQVVQSREAKRNCQKPSRRLCRRKYAANPFS